MSDIYRPALDNMVVPAVMFFPGVHFPFLNPKNKTETIILGFKKSPKFATDRVPRGLELSHLCLFLEPGGLLSVCSDPGLTSMGPGSTHL